MTRKGSSWQLRAVWLVIAALTKARADVSSPWTSPQPDQRNAVRGSEGTRNIESWMGDDGSSPSAAAERPRGRTLEESEVEWFIQTHYGDTDCILRESATLEPLGLCVQDSDHVYMKRKCSVSGGKITIQSNLYRDSKCKDQPFEANTEHHAISCASKTTAECSTESDILSWPAKATFSGDDPTCSGWAEKVKAYTPDCGGNVTKKATCSADELSIETYRTAACDAGDVLFTESTYNLENCSKITDNNIKFYYASCEGVLALPGVTSSGKKNDDENGDIFYTWWAILLTCIGVLCVLGLFFRVGLKNRANEGVKVDGDDDYERLEDVDTIRGSFCEEAWEPRSDSTPTAKPVAEVDKDPDDSFSPSGDYLIVETNGIDLGNINRMRGSFM